MFCQFLLYSKVTQSYIYTYIFFLHHPPSYSITSDGYSSLCYTAGSHCLSTPNALVCIYLLSWLLLRGTRARSQNRSSHGASVAMNPTSSHEDTGSIPGLVELGLRSGIALSCGVGRRCSSDPALLWLWCPSSCSSDLTPSLRARP